MLFSKSKWQEKKNIYLCRIACLSLFFVVSFIAIITLNNISSNIMPNFDKTKIFSIKIIGAKAITVEKDVAGVILLLLILALFIAIYFYFFEKEFTNQCNNMVAVTTILILNLLLTKFLLPIPNFAIPTFMAVILISLLINIRISMILNMIMSIITTLLVGDKSLNFVVYLFLAGSLTAIFANKIHTRKQFLVYGFLSSLISPLFVFSINLVYNVEFETIISDSINSFLGTALSFVIAYGTLPIWEFVFDYATSIRLMELSNPNHPLLKRLLMEAPGTYHHSLIVANLAEIACEAVGGNYLLARVGAYYHDIGKLKRPFYFKENQIVSEDPHNKITPTLSTLIITSHTKDGVEIGKEYKLPRQVLDIIKQHHGTTRVLFFYNKAIIQSQDINEQKFRYEGPIPQTKEAAIVMLADSVEAAVRALSSPNHQLVENTVRNIINEKLMDGQLNASNITFKELEIITENFIRVLTGVFHKRVNYDLVDKNKDKIEEVIKKGEDSNSKSAGKI